MTTTADDCGIHELLLYDAQHGVLICRQCQYAIQKTAIESHLLRHKIYRNERRRIMTAIAQLNILEPDQVQLPPPTSSPVPGLPVLHGLKCARLGCAMLYASSKRMKWHWVEAHGITDVPDDHAVEIQMQTFFRGTKNKYFEVNSTTADVHGEPNLSVASRQDQTSGANDTPKIIARPSSTLTVDLDLLQYFHHFTAVTSLTLPLGRGQNHHYWQGESVQRALTQKPLMAGLMALSAAHLIASSQDATQARKHTDAKASFEKLFYDGSTVSALRSIDPESQEAISRLEEQVKYIIILASWSQGSHKPQQIPAGLVPFTVQAFKEHVIGCASIPVDFAHADGSPVDTDTQHATRKDASPLPESVAVKRVHRSGHQSRAAFGRAQHALDAITTLAVMNGLSERLRVCNLRGDPRLVWSALSSWLQKPYEHFLQMAARKEPPALVALAHGAVLIDQAARSYWFLEGLAERWYWELVAELPRKNRAVMEMVEGLLEDCHVPSSCNQYIHNGN
ncbi:hypothetical protein Micbo1qcDRAFT_214889 [Microdochium bolleyi]|uniref:C2H2-type domain-containing protein n=1 Tax=Microdochium bolleyi TaxID=196109 RepID=A0A136ITI2_9PEZI|nr:hypothetical protein Micbo1qcDRAFT_214889 [Microdochium bolleyi]